MKLGFYLRRKFIDLIDLARDFSSLVNYFLWIFLDPSKFKRIDKKNVRNILVEYGGVVGDAYSMVGILNNLIKNNPKTKVYYLTTEKNRKFIKNPKINVCTKSKALDLIKKGKIDLGIFFKGISIKESKEFFSLKDYRELMKIPYRVTYIPPHFTSTFRKIPLLSNKKKFPFHSHYFGDRYDLFNELGIKVDKMEFFHTPDARKKIDKLIKKYGLSKQDNLIIIHIGSGKTMRAIKQGKIPSSVWPEKRWADLSKKLLKDKSENKLIFTGLKEEKEQIEKIIKKIRKSKRIYNFAGKLTIEDIANLFTRSQLLICVDGALAHIGGQVGIDEVILFGAGKPHYHKPMAPKGKLKSLAHLESCIGCRRSDCPEKNNICMKNISVEEVFNSANKFIEKD